MSQSLKNDLIRYAFSIAVVAGLWTAYGMSVTPSRNTATPSSQPQAVTDAREEAAAIQKLEAELSSLRAEIAHQSILPKETLPPAASLIVQPGDTAVDRIVSSVVHHTIPEPVPMQPIVPAIQVNRAVPKLKPIARPVIQYQYRPMRRRWRW